MDMSELPVADLRDAGEDIDLFGQEGNAYSLIAIGKGWLEQIGKPGYADTLMAQMMDGDYEHLLRTLDAWFNTDLYSYYMSEMENDDDYDY